MVGVAKARRRRQVAVASSVHQAQEFLHPSVQRPNRTVVIDLSAHPDVNDQTFDDVIVAIRQSQPSGSVKEISVNDCGLGPDSMLRLTDALTPTMATEVIAFSGNAPGPQGLLHLASHAGRWLTRLYLGRCMLDDADCTKLLDGFAGAKAPGCALEVLSLANNRITALPDHAGYKKLPHLHSLELQGNSLRTLPAHLLAGANAIRRLDISDNQFGALPTHLFALSHLSDLNAGGNQLESFPRVLFTHKEMSLKQRRRNVSTMLPSCPLTTLDLSRNAIASLPDKGWNLLPNLKQLYLSFNHITEIPRNFTLRLTQVRLEGNEITLPNKLSYRQSLLDNEESLSTKSSMRVEDVVTARKSTVTTRSLPLSRTHSKQVPTARTSEIQLVEKEEVVERTEWETYWAHVRITRHLSSLSPARRQTLQLFQLDRQQYMERFSMGGTVVEEGAAITIQAVFRGRRERQNNPLYQRLQSSQMARLSKKKKGKKAVKKKLPW